MMIIENNKELPKVYKNINFVPKAWGWEEWIANGNYCLKYLFIRQEHATSWHYHRLKDETFRILEGTLQLLIGWDDNISFAQPKILYPGDCINIPVGLKHRLYGVTDVLLLEVSDHHEDSDSIRLEVGY
jgi:mannose-6-phosphate isomerase-like protein (cupin superfamily)